MPVNIPAFDLNLLVVFDAVMTERSVSRAAERIGMSQPAVSNALNRLRDQLQDQLFIRTSDGVRPTERAIAMAADITDGLRNLQVALEPRELSTAKHWKFVVSMSEQTMVAVLPRLLSIIETSGKSIAIHIKHKANKTILREIDSMEVDVAVGTIPDLPPRFDRSLLYHDKYVIMMARNNPLSKRPITARDFPKLEQIAVRGNLESYTRIDRDLQACNATRNVVMNVTQYLVLPKVLTATSLVSLVPRSVIEHFDPGQFCFQEIPFDIPESEVLAVVHRSRGRNTAIRWLLGALEEACTDLTRILKQPLSAA